MKSYMWICNGVPQIRVVIIVMLIRLIIMLFTIMLCIVICLLLNIMVFGVVVMGNIKV